MGDKQNHVKQEEIKLEKAKLREDRQMEYEALRHKNVMEEIEALKKAKITHFHRGDTHINKQFLNEKQQQKEE